MPPFVEGESGASSPVLFFWKNLGSFDVLVCTALDTVVSTVLQVGWLLSLVIVVINMSFLYQDYASGSSYKWVSPHMNKTSHMIKPHTKHS